MYVINKYQTKEREKKSKSCKETHKELNPGFDEVNGHVGKAEGLGNAPQDQSKLELPDCGYNNKCCFLDWGGVWEAHEGF